MCSLQEAYNVDSFPSSRPRKSAKRCSAPQAPASADAYDPYTPESGRGELAAAGAALNAAPGATAMRRYGREDFVSATPPSAVRIGDRDKVTYKGMANDYKYYKEYGVDLPSLEGFASGSGSGAALPTDPTAAAAARRSGPPPPPRGVCGAPAPQRYEFPVTPESRAAYDRAIAANLAQESGATAAPRPMARQADMSQVTGYYDPELESYLSTSELAAAPPMLTRPRAVNVAPSGPTDATPYDPEGSPFGAALQRFSAGRPEAIPAAVARATHAAADAPRATTPTGLKIPADSWQGVWEILLFVVAGVLVLFLCEQLFKIAVMIGMRQTMDMLEPFLDKAAAAATGAARR